MNLRRGLILLAMLAGTPAWADDGNWPDKPIRVVLPFPGGGMGDTVTRMIGDELRARLGQPVVIDNRPGGGGNIGAAAVAQAPADGYTLLLGATNNFVINQFLYRDMSFDPLQALEPVTIIADVPAVIFVNASTPAKSFQEFIAFARANRGRLNYATPGAGSTTHLASELISRSHDLGLMHIPYKGGSPAMTALLANDVHFYLVAAGSGAPFVKAGKLNAIAVSNPSRLPALPDTPTFGESGLGTIRASNWWALAAPRGVPQEIMKRLYAPIRDWLGTPAAQAKLRDLGLVPVGRSPAETKDQLAAEAAYWRRAIQETGAKVD